MTQHYKCEMPVSRREANIIASHEDMKTKIIDEAAANLNLSRGDLDKYFELTWKLEDTKYVLYLREIS